MERKILQGVKPFNDFFYKSCYFHQLIAALGAIGIDGRDIFLNEFLEFGRNFHIVDEGLLNEKELRKALGYRANHTNINEKVLIKAIDSGKPVLVGIDCYYLKIRDDTYLKHHSPHFILVYGYDMLARTVNIVEHNYVNSFLYNERLMPLDELMLANERYEKGICRSKTTSVIISKGKKSKLYEFMKRTLGDKDKLSLSRDNLINCLNYLKELFVSGAEDLKSNCLDILAFIERIKLSRLSLSKTKITELSEGLEMILCNLDCGYAYLKSLFLKMKCQNNFKYAESRLDNIFRKIDNIISLESKFYEIALEAKL